MFEAVQAVTLDEVLSGGHYHEVVQAGRELDVIVDGNEPGELGFVDIEHAELADLRKVKNEESAASARAHVGHGGGQLLNDLVPGQYWGSNSEPVAHDASDSQRIADAPDFLAVLHSNDRVVHERFFV